MRVLKSIFLIINYKTFIVTILSLLCTWFCFKYGIRADFPLTLVGIAIVFPVVFSIDSAYKRRENALMHLADIKGHLSSLFYASKYWMRTPDHDMDEEMKQLVINIFKEIEYMFVSEKEKSKEHEKKLYGHLSELSAMTKKFREHDLPSGELSRMYQYVSKIYISVENLKVILKYRTPITLRAYSKVFIYAFPIFYSPYFVFQAEHYTKGLEYMMPVVFSFILVSLDNIQAHLENPFDQVGEDDIKFDLDEFAKTLE